MKKIISMIILIVTILGLFIPTNVFGAEKFNDIANHWAKESITDMVDFNIINGYQDGTFKPNNTLKFEEFIKLVVAATSDENIEVSEGMFWYENYMNKALENNYITEIMLVNIGRNITRKTMADILYKVIENNEGIEAYETSDFEYLAEKLTDLSIKDEETLTIAGMGIIAGYPDETFKPNNNLTRAETVTVIYRLIDKSKRLPVEIEVQLPPVQKVELKDLPSVDLDYLYDYQTVTGGHIKDTSIYYHYGKNSVGSGTGNIIEEYTTFMNLMHNRDYTTINKNSKDYIEEINYVLNTHKEYKNVQYSQLREYNLIAYDNSPEVIEYILNNKIFIEDFFDKWINDTIDYEVEVESEFYTNDNLIYNMGGHTALRGVLRIRYNSHDNPSNIYEELDLVKREKQTRGNNGTYLDLNNLPKIEVGKWYDIAIDIEMLNRSVAHGMDEVSFYNYIATHPISITEVK